MEGFMASGKAFCVVEDLKRFAEEHKGITVAEFLRKRREAQLEVVEAGQFGIDVEEFGKIIKKNLKNTIKTFDIYIFLW